jgi:hypothetical protein
MCLIFTPNPSCKVLYLEGHGLNEKPTTPDPVYNHGIRV